MKFFKSLIQKFSGKPVDWDELEEMLIRSDLGVPMSLRIVARLQERALTQTITAQDVVEVAREEILRVLPIQPSPIRPLPAKPKAILIVGVNGTGKTTSTAKLAHYFQRNRHSVLLAAADTFRAAAIEQLAIWAERLKIEMIRGQYNADPAALCYEAYESADRRDIEFLLCDTAGVSIPKATSWLSWRKLNDRSQNTIRRRRTNGSSWSMPPTGQQCPRPGAGISRRGRSDRSHRDQARWQWQRRGRDRDPARAWDSDTLCRHR